MDNKPKVQTKLTFEQGRLSGISKVEEIQVQPLQNQPNPKFQKQSVLCQQGYDPKYLMNKMNNYKGLIFKIQRGYLNRTQEQVFGNQIIIDNSIILQEIPKASQKQAEQPQKLEEENEIEQHPQHDPTKLEEEQEIAVQQQDTSILQEEQEYNPQQNNLQGQQNQNDQQEALGEQGEQHNLKKSDQSDLDQTPPLSGKIYDILYIIKIELDEKQKVQFCQLEGAEDF